MINKSYYSSFAVSMLLIAAVLQACAGSKTKPAVLSVKTPDRAQLPAEVNVLTPASQPKEKSSATQPEKQPHVPQHPVNAASMLQSTAASGGVIADKKASPALSMISQQPQPIVLEDDYPERFKPSAMSPQYSPQGNYPLATERKNLLDHSIAEFTDERLHGADSKDHQPSPPSIDALLKRLQNLDGHDLVAYPDCLETIAKAVSSANATCVLSALDKAHYRLSSARKAARDLQALKLALKVIETMQADLTHFQRILREEAPATPSACSLICGCCEEMLEINFRRVGKIVRTYPKMAEAVVPVVLERHRVSLLYNTSKAEFIHDCLMAYPQHTPALLSIMRAAFMNSPIDELIFGQQRIETELVDVLASFVEENPDYAEEGIHILNTAFCNTYNSVRIQALQACTRILCVCPQCSRHIDQVRLYHAFESLQSALKGPGSTVKALARATLEKLEKYEVPFLRRVWNHYVRTRNINQS